MHPRAKLPIHEIFRRPEPPGPWAERSRRVGRVVLALLACLFGACLLYAGLWVVLAAQSRASVTAWLEDRRASGYRAAHGELDVGGFPFHIRLAAENVELASPDAADPWSWSAARVLARMRPWNPDRITVSVFGVQTLDVGVGGRTLRLRGEAKDLEAAIELSDGQPVRAELAMRHLSVISEASQETASIGRMDLSLYRHLVPDSDYQTPTIEVRLDAGDLRLPPSVKAPLGSTLDSIAVDARLKGKAPLGPWPRDLVRWRDQGGTVDVTRLDVSYGPLHLGGDGTLALDGDLQPIGAFTAKIEGFFETLAALEDRGLVSARDALTAKVVLGALAKRPSRGGRAVLNVSLTLQGRKLYAGPISILTMPRVRWRQTPGSE